MRYSAKLTLPRQPLGYTPEGADKRIQYGYERFIDVVNLALPTDDFTVEDGAVSTCGTAITVLGHVTPDAAETLRTAFARWYRDRACTYDPGTLLDWDVADEEDE